MKKSIIGLSLLAAFSFNASVQAEEASDWSFQVSPYGYLNNIAGTASAGGLNDVSADMEFEQIFENLDATLMIAGEAVHKSGWGFAVDYGMMELSKSFATPRDGVLFASNRLGRFRRFSFQTY